MTLPSITLWCTACRPSPTAPPERNGTRVMPDSKDHLYFPAILDPKDHLHWSRIKNLMLTLLGLWIFYFLVVHIFITTLNKITVPVLGFPLGFYLAAQG